MCLKSGHPDLFLTLFSVNYVTGCVINMLSIWWIKHTMLKYQTMFCTRLIKSPDKQDESHCPIYTHLKPVSFLTANNCLPCWLSVLLVSHSISSLASSLVPSIFPPLCSLSTPPLNRTAVLAGYHAWSIPCYHREINYLDQAARERGNNERMLLLPRR